MSASEIAEIKAALAEIQKEVAALKWSVSCLSTAYGRLKLAGAIGVGLLAGLGISHPAAMLQLLGW